MTIHRPYRHPLDGSAHLVRLTPDDAGWDWVGLQVLRLEAAVSVTVDTGDSECFVLPLDGGPVAATADHGSGVVKHSLVGRDSAFAGATDFLYVSRDMSITLTSDDECVVALPAARCARQLEPRYGAAADVAVEQRGAGQALRNVRNFGVPGEWDHAEKLIACEVLTPPGNWSSYPPHKHDASAPCPVINEEIYYYRIQGEAGFGYHRTYTGPEHAVAGLAPIDETLEVHDHDVVLVPHGYHGPCMAAPDYPMYYLNVMAGPASERSMAYCDDPSHAWIREAWMAST
jgi:5-deoxy-glucuronate isomerase